jgi:hypothetical protein
VSGAADFFTVEVRTPRGLFTHYVLFVIVLATRALEITDATANPTHRSWRRSPET